MIKYYDAEASSDSAELEDMNNAYVYAYKNNYRADSHHSEIIGDRYTANKPRVKKVNRTRNSEYRTNIARNSEYNANTSRNSVYNSNVTLDGGVYSYRANNDKLKRNEKIYNRRIVGDKNNVSDKGSNKDKIRKSAMERKKNIIRIFDVIICFLMLMLISYRYATIKTRS